MDGLCIYGYLECPTVGHNVFGPTNNRPVLYYARLLILRKISQMVVLLHRYSVHSGRLCVCSVELDVGLRRKILLTHYIGNL